MTGKHPFRADNTYDLVPQQRYGKTFMFRPLYVNGKKVQKTIQIQLQLQLMKTLLDPITTTGSCQLELFAQGTGNPNESYGPQMEDGKKMLTAGKSSSLVTKLTWTITK